METSRSVMQSNLFMDRFGEVVLTLDSDGLSWKPVGSQEKFASRRETGIMFSDVYAVELINWGSVHELIPNARGLFLGRNSEMYRFVVHGFQKSKVRDSKWHLAAYTFGDKELQTCQTWVEKINSYLNMEVGRPKSLLVFVHPLSGKGNGCKTWATVAPIFARAEVKTKVTVTQRSGHAFDVVTSITNRELSSYDGIIAVGGDGFFNEILNGLLLSRHKAPNPPTPKEFCLSVESQVRCQLCRINHGSNGRTDSHDVDCNVTKTSLNDGDDPLLSNSESTMLGFSDLEKEAGHCVTDQDPVFSFPNDLFRLGIIPSGSTDAIVISTTGTRDPVTSALHIVLGKRVCLDIAQIVRWKTSGASINPPSVRYAASFAGYGFYGDVIKESEKYRWMGPKRYDYAGTMVFLKHRSYQADIAFLEAKPSNLITRTGSFGSGAQSFKPLQQKYQNVICRVNCIVCKEAMDLRHDSVLANADDTGSSTHSENLRWLWSKGSFISVGAAIISCRNERSPDGLVADAHLADGFLHLILIKECPLPLYLWHLTQLTRKGSNPLNFEFVEHHKTRAFTFTSSGDESVWNLDGELLQASHLSAQAFQGLISLFAAGPEV